MNTNDNEVEMTQDQFDAAVNKWHSNIATIARAMVHEGRLWSAFNVGEPMNIEMTNATIEPARCTEVLGPAAYFKQHPDEMIFIWVGLVGGESSIRPLTFCDCEKPIYYVAPGRKGTDNKLHVNVDRGFYQCFECFGTESIPAIMRKVRHRDWHDMLWADTCKLCNDVRCENGIVYFSLSDAEGMIGHYEVERSFFKLFRTLEVEPDNCPDVDSFECYDEDGRLEVAS